MPLTLASAGLRVDADTALVLPSDLTDAVPDSTRSFARSLVEDTNYRDLNLAANYVYMRHPCDPIPEYIGSLIDSVRQDRDSPGPSLDEVRQAGDLYNLSMGVGEPVVEKYFHTHIFPDPALSDSLKRTDKIPMAKHCVPSTRSKFRVSTPVPDMLYGYNRYGVFLWQQAQPLSMGTQPIANTDRLLYPFFVIEFKGEGGSMWVATNQCLGGSSSCVNVVEHLNRQLKHYRSDNIIRPVDNAAFSIAMNGTEA